MTAIPLCAAQSQNRDALTEAKAAIARGWPIFPIAPKSKKPLAGSHGHLDATTDPAAIDKWAEAHPGCNFAVSPSSKLVIIEVDPRRGGTVTLDKLRDRIPPTAEAISGGGGLHIYLDTNGKALKSRFDPWGKGVELKGSGNYVLIPGSATKSGQYRWDRHPDVVGIAPAPDWVIQASVGQSNVTEKMEAILSDFSASSALSVTSPPSRSLSAFSVFSVTTPDEVIQKTLPKVPGERNQRILELARGVKFNLRMRDADAPTLRGIVRKWHELALPNITTKSFDESWSDFLHAFDRARYPIDVSLVDCAAQRIDPDELHPVTNDYDNQSTKTLICICYELSKLTGTGKFFISTHDAAARLGLTPMQAWRLLRMLDKDGVIKTLDKGNEYRAARYQFVAKGEVE